MRRIGKQKYTKGNAHLKHVFSNRNELRNLARSSLDRCPWKSVTAGESSRNFGSSDFRRVEVSVFIGSLLADFLYAVHEERPIPGQPELLHRPTALTLWRAARDPWNPPRKGCRLRWMAGWYEGCCTKRHVTHILPTFRESRAKKASLLAPAARREGGGGLW